jgi:hypothetical protein
MVKYRLTGWAVVLAILVTGFSSATAVAETGPASGLKPVWGMIEYKNGMLRVEMENAPLMEVLEELETATGALFTLKDETLLDEPLSVEIKEEDLEKALKRILRDYSYVTHFDSKGAVDRVIIYGRIDGRPGSPSRSATYAGRSSVRSTQKLEGIRTAPGEGQQKESGLHSEGASQSLEPSEQVKAEGYKEAANEEPSDDPSEVAANAPHDLDEFMPLPEENYVEETGDYEYDEQDPDAGRLAAEKQAERQKRIDQARLNRSMSALESEHSHLRSMAVEEMSRISDPRVPGALRGVATSDESTASERQKAAQALWNYAADQQFSDSGANQALSSLVDSKDPSVKKIAEQALRDMERYQKRYGR